MNLRDASSSACSSGTGCLIGPFQILSAQVLLLRGVRLGGLVRSGSRSAVTNPPSRHNERRPSYASSASGSKFTTSSMRSEEHTSELQSQSNLVCRLLLEKKKKEKHINHLTSREVATARR